MSTFEKVTAIAQHIKHYALMAAGGAGLTGSRAAAGPLNAQIGIADPCNHRCVFCRDHPPEGRESERTANRFGGERAGLMSLDQFQEVVNDLHRLGTRRIDLVGRGESLLNPAALEMIRYAKRKKMHLSLITNGSRISEEFARGFVDTRLDHVNVSLNAGTPESYPEIHVTETPENYRRVLRNVRCLADVKSAARAQAPVLRFSFVITSRNYCDLERMVRVGGDAGVQEAYFTHVVLQDATPDLALNAAQYQELQASIPAARAAADALGVATNLASFGASAPPYMEQEIVGSSVVPCYAGWYFTVILGNGTVLPCCQCNEPVDTLKPGRGFAEIWASPRYREFREAARNLPAPSPRLASCECDSCQLRPRNLAIHNFLHPLSPLEAGGDVKSFTPASLVRKLLGRRADLT
jgi:MoaA/NifB/PqqE/SkfB family radical SAM enzyme